jgi:hypothetical protein
MCHNIATLQQIKDTGTGTGEFTKETEHSTRLNYTFCFQQSCKLSMWTAWSIIYSDIRLTHIAVMLKYMVIWHESLKLLQISTGSEVKDNTCIT